MNPFGAAALLGILQGLTEFLPVSSSGHLSLASFVFGLDKGGLTLNVMLHAGTLLATLLVLWQRFAPAVREGTLGIVQPRRFVSTLGGRDALVIILASVPTAVLGLTLHDAVERFTLSPTAVGVGFVVTTLLLVSTKWVASGEAPTPTAWGALAMGLAQGLAVFPGVSRSGATIAVALWLGIRRDRAFELSMLMSVPAVTGAVLLELPGLLDGPIRLSAAVVGASVAFVSGVGALLVLKRLVLQGRLAWFVLWVGPLALATLAMAKAWPDK
jgi:undecaprenyl-diphosphatase